MNERIKELAEQAFCDIKDEFGYWIGREFDQEKFAELIVQECMDITKQCSTGKGIHDLFADEIIAEHFGVEE